ncbi:hypothetical protein SD70_07555 [Gordoniibacillus kamchatkensis]|uniref:Pilus assembly protein PilZ n=2 Tax=Gordoniibacillus kamchatkensis TaxID=1590651 RepID=A0ABR5ALA4_9BACL|nr:hypothetical protein SD70_07555 [Paenibacillus sp. VKM B-2647]
MGELWANQLIEIESVDGARYKTQILKIENEEIYIQRPVSKHQESMPLLHGNGKDISVYFYNDLKELYTFDTVLTVRNGRPVMAKPLPGSVYKVQRRNYFRVPARVKLEVQHPSGEIHRFMTEDLSGGGVSFLCSSSDIFKVNDEVKGTIRLETTSDTVLVEFAGKVANTKLITDGGRKFGLAFSDISEKHRSAIIRHCIKRQCEIISKVKKM